MKYQRAWAVRTSGSVSPQSSLMSVDLPAPLAPSTAMRLPSEQRQLTSISCGLSAPGYVKDTCAAAACNRVRMPALHPLQLWG